MVASWDGRIAEASRRFNVPEQYIRAVMQAESSGNPGAVSGAGAGGLMQVMPKTYAEIAGNLGLGADRMDPGNNITAGTSYLRDLNNRYGGDWHKTLYGYNAGPGTVAQVDAGKRDYKPESKAYVDKVLAQFTQTKEPDMPLFSGSTGGATDADMERWGGLLNFGSPNYAEGMGILGNIGQTPSQPPRTQPTTDTTQTQRMDVSGRINELLQSLSNTPAPASRMGPGGYMLAGAGDAVGKLAGVHDRKVGIGEILGALGGGVTRGGLAGQQAQRDDTESEVQNLYRLASAQKALAPERDAKVVGKGVYVNGKWEAAPWASAGSDGPLEGTGPEAQFTNAYIMLEQKRASGQPLTQQESLLYDTAVRFLNKPKLATGPDGVVREVAPAPLPTLGSAGAPPAGQASATMPGPAVAPPAEQPRVREIVPPKPKDIPATVQAGMLENVNGLRKVEDALAALSAEPDATGLTIGALSKVMPDSLLNMAFPGGTDARAKIADIGSLRLHERSGANITASESPRLIPFIPTASDDAKTVRIKLENFAKIYREELNALGSVYSPETGYQRNPVVEQTLKTGRAFRAQAPISGQDPNNPANTGQGGAAHLSDDEIKRKLGL
jgi:hypothetical protein